MEAPSPTAEPPYTLADIRELLQYKIDSSRHADDIRRKDKGIYSDASEFMNFQHWIAYNTPYPGRLIEDAALSLPLYRRLLKTAKGEYHDDLSPTVLTAIIADILGVVPVWTMPLDEFEKRWNEKGKPPAVVSGRVITLPTSAPPPLRSIQVAAQALPEEMNSLARHRAGEPDGTRDVHYLTIRRKLESKGHSLPVVEWAIHEHVQAGRLEVIEGGAIESRFGVGRIPWLDGTEAGPSPFLETRPSERSNTRTSSLSTTKEGCYLRWTTKLNEWWHALWSRPVEQAVGELQEPKTQTIVEIREVSSKSQAKRGRPKVTDANPKQANLYRNLVERYPAGSNKLKFIEDMLKDKDILALAEAAGETLDVTTLNAAQKWAERQK